MLAKVQISSLVFQASGPILTKRFTIENESIMDIKNSV